MATKRVLLIGGGVLAGIVVLVALTVIVPELLSGPLSERVAAQVQGDIVLQDLKANSFGRQSQGKAQVRGNGALVLTRDRLHFITLGAPDGYTVPVSAITSVDTVNTHLGKTTPFPLLQVRWTEGGAEDSAAFYVKDLPAWQRQLEALRQKK